MEHAVVGEPTEITAGWMTTALEAAGVAQGATVLDVTFEGLIGTGQMSRNARFSLTWDQPGRPGRCVGKFPAADPTARTTGFDGGYQKEWTFYRHLKPGVDVSTPDVWVALFDHDALDFVIIMEHMEGAEQGDQFRGLTEHEATLAVEQAVKFHAPKWGDPALLTLFGKDVEEAPAKIGMIYPMLVEMSLDRLGDLVDDQSREVARALSPLVERWILSSDTPYTLVHMDYRPDNFMFGVTPDARPITVVDWATITCGPGTHDIAYMIGGSFEPEDRRRVERGLVEHYRRLLNEAGVAYDADTCWRDYRLSSLWGVVMSIIATMLAQETERGNRMLATMLRRHVQHAVDLDALSLLA